MNSLAMKKLETEDPRTDFWICFKVSGLERLRQMQSGLIYMNSLKYFASLSDEPALAARKDEMEQYFALLHAGKHGETTYRLELEYGDPDDRKAVDMGQSARMRIYFPKPEELMVYCMGAFSVEELAGAESGDLIFDDRFHEFGDHVLLIRNPMEFANRVQLAINKCPQIYRNPLVTVPYGLVDYVSMESGPVVKGLFKKPSRYNWQREFRFSFGVKQEGLNEEGACELHIGTIDDISSIVPLQPLLEHPLQFKRRIYSAETD